MITQRRLVAATLLALGVVSCSNGEGRGRLVSTGSSGTPPPTGVALGTCLEPEVRPTFWTLNCGDAGYQLTDLRYSRWDEQAAVATGTAVIAIGPLSGNHYAVRVMFDQPESVTEFGGRRLFSRLVVDYTDGPGPEGKRHEVTPLQDMWADARSLLDEPIPPCRPGECAPDPGGPYEEQPTASTTPGG